MKKLKLFLCVALFGAMSFGAFSAYDYYTMSADERAFLENVEALTSGEPGGGGITATSCLGLNDSYCKTSKGSVGTGPLVEVDF